MIFFLKMIILLLGFTRARHTIANGDTTHNSIVFSVQLLATLLFVVLILCVFRDISTVPAISLTICIIYFHVFRNCIHLLCECTILTLYTVLYIRYPPLQSLHTTPTGPLHPINTVLFLIIRSHPHISELACSTSSTIHYS